MKKILFTLLIIHSSFIIAEAQVQQEWVRRYPDTSTGNAFNAGAYALALDDSGNVYITGYVDYNNIPPYNNGYCTIKYNAGGVQLWVSNYYGTNSGGRFAFAIALDSSSNVYVTGYSYEVGRDFDFCTVKYNSSGVQQWVEYYDDPYHGEDEAEKIAVDNAGNIYVSGYSQVTSGGAFAYTTVKYSIDGRELWVRTYPLTTSINYVRGLLVDDSCRVYVTGDYLSRAVTVKYDSSGNQLWSQQYSGLGIGLTGAKTIALDENKNVYIAGFSGGTVTSSDFFTIKYSYSGVQQWVKRFNTDSNSNQNQNKANSIAVDYAGNVYVSGYTCLNAAYPMHFCTIKYSNSGDVIWTQIDTAVLRSQNTTMNIDSRSNVYIAGSYGILYAPYLIIKYDSSGHQQWEQFYQFSYGDSYPSCLQINKGFNVFLTGSSGVSMCTIKYAQPVGINKNSEETVGRFKLFQNYPNPFNPVTKIRFQISVFGMVSVKVYDILGREITDPVNEELKPGNYKIEFDGSNYSSGIYFYTLTTDNHRETKKMVLIK